MTDISVGSTQSAVDLINGDRTTKHAHPLGTIACPLCRQVMSKAGLRTGDRSTGRMHRCPSCLDRFALLIDKDGDLHAFRTMQDATGSGVI